MLDLDPKTTALVVVDLQYGILAIPMTPHPGEQVVARCVELGQAMAGAGGTVALIRNAYSARYADRQNQPADAPLNLPVEGLPEDWATLVPEIAGLAAQVHITKRQHSAFYGTELDLQLRRRRIETAIVCGLATNFGVEATARDAYSANYAVVIASDACSSTAPALHEFAIRNVLPRIARVRTSSEILAALS